MTGITEKTDNIKAIEAVLDKYFRDEKMMYYTPADAISMNQFIRWAYLRGERDKIIISIGSDDGEVEIKVCYNASKIEALIKAIIQ